MTRIKQEKLVFILVILYIRKYLCVFYEIVYGGIRRLPISGIPPPNITENTQPYQQAYLWHSSENFSKKTVFRICP